MEGQSKRLAGILKSLDRLKTYQYHFSDYEFKGVFGLNAPDLSKKEWLTQEYFYFIDELKLNILNNNHLNEVPAFMEHFIPKVDSSKLDKLEYHMMMLKFNEISYWLFGNSFPKDYYDKESHRKVYANTK